MKKHYDITVALSAYIDIDVFANDDKEAYNCAMDVIHKMSDEELIKAVKGLRDVDEVQFCGEESITKIKLLGAEWDVLPYAHTPKTPIFGYTCATTETDMDWKVIETEFGNLWMNNCDGYMYIIGEHKTYIRYF